jgi:hypothetical protein
MPKRDMTPDERQRFEEGVVHNDDERRKEGRPASDPQVRDEQKPEGSVAAAAESGLTFLILTIASDDRSLDRVGGGPATSLVD